jgi:hypothetical protein
MEMFWINFLISASAVNMYMLALKLLTNSFSTLNHVSVISVKFLLSRCAAVLTDWADVPRC